MLQSCLDNQDWQWSQREALRALAFQAYTEVRSALNLSEAICFQYLWRSSDSN